MIMYLPSRSESHAASLCQPLKWPLAASRLIETFVDQLAPTLTAIYNQSILERVVLHDWKCANVMPLFKKGNKARKLRTSFSHET